MAKSSGKALVRDRVARYGIACDLKAGCFHAATKPRHMAKIRATQALWREAYGYPGLDLAEGNGRARAYVNSPRYIGGLYDPGAGHLHPEGAEVRFGIHEEGGRAHDAVPFAETTHQTGDDVLHRRHELRAPARGLDRRPALSIGSA